MEILVVLAVLVGAAYMYFKGNTKRGAETVRASIFLKGMEAGETVAEANRVSSFDFEQAPPEALRSAIERATSHMTNVYGGKQLPMIADAYRKGMHSQRPLWYRMIAGLATGIGSNGGTEAVRGPSAPHPATGPTPDWARPFVLYYVASEFAKEMPGDMPATVGDLALGRTSIAVEQSILASLRTYLPFAYGRERESGDLGLAVREARDVLQVELRTGNSRLALKRLCRKLHTENGTMTVSESELQSIIQQTVDTIRSDDQAASRFRTLLLEDGIQSMFSAQHGQSFATYESRIQ